MLVAFMTGVTVYSVHSVLHMQIASTYVRTYVCMCSVYHGCTVPAKSNRAIVM